MPKNGAWMTSEYPGETISFSCGQCGMAGSEDRSELLRSLGDLSLPHLLSVFAKSKGCHRVANPYYDTCKMGFGPIVTKWLMAQGGNIKMKGPPQRVGDLEESHCLLAKCNACGRTHEVYWGELKGRANAQTTLYSLGSRMKCRCGHKGAQMYIGKRAR